MKLLTRIKISYFLAFICPVVLILATVVGVMKMGLNSMEQKCRSGSVQLRNDPGSHEHAGAYDSIHGGGIGTGDEGGAG